MTGALRVDGSIVFLLAPSLRHRMSLTSQVVHCFASGSRGFHGLQIPNIPPYNLDTCWKISSRYRRMHQSSDLMSIARQPLHEMPPNKAARPRH